MLTQTDIANTIRLGKFHSSTLLQKIVDRRYYGEKECNEKTQFIILLKWTQILEDYFEAHYDQDGNITPVGSCLDADQISLLVSKIKVLVGNYKYPIPRYFLAEGYFNDEGYIFEDSNNYIRDYVYWS